MRVLFHEAALAELAWEVQYYAKVNPKLGERFATVAERALAIAAEFPDMGSPHRYGTRRAFPKRFPFSVVYLHRSDEILVLSVRRARTEEVSLYES